MPGNLISDLSSFVIDQFQREKGTFTKIYISCHLIVRSMQIGARCTQNSNQKQKDVFLTYAASIKHWRLKVCRKWTTFVHQKSRNTHTNMNAKNQGKIHKTNPLGLKLPFNKWRFCDSTPVCFQMLQNDNP